MIVDNNDRSDLILQSAKTLFHERGFGAVGVDLIGERAGLSGPAIYRYFAGKDDILLSLLDEAVDRVIVATGGEFTDPHDELHQLVTGHVRQVVSDRELVGVWLKELTSIPRPKGSRLRSRINRYIERWVDCLAACYPGVEPAVLRLATHATHGMIDSVALWPSAALEVEGIEEMLSQMALSGLETFSSGPRQPRRRPKVDRLGPTSVRRVVRPPQTGSQT